VPSYSNDAWFEHMAIVVSDIDAAYKILQENNVRQISAHPITIPQTNPGAAGIEAIKFHDPERHDLELIHFPPGKSADRGEFGEGSDFLSRFAWLRGRRGDAQ
jgi:hypothetical protein